MCNSTLALPIRCYLIAPSLLMKRLLAGLLGFTALTIVGGAISGYAIAVLSAPHKELIYQKISCPGERRAKTEDLKVLSTHKWSQGVVVLYSATCPAEAKESKQRVFGHRVFKQTGMNWSVSGTSSYAIETSPTASQRLVDYGMSKSSQGEPYTVLYGQVLSPRVTAIEATFDNGKVLRDVSTNGVFAIVAAQASAVCEVRVLGSDNQILRQEDLVMPNSLTGIKKVNQCLPVSHQL